MIFADTETTDLTEPKVCSIAMIKVDQFGSIVDTLYEMINPEKEVSLNASQVNGFSLELLPKDNLDKIFDKNELSPNFLSNNS